MRSLSFQRLIGTGAIGSVYAAELVGDHGFRRTVAVKVLQQGLPNAEMFVGRVRDEARLLGLLEDEHLLKVLELVRVDGRDAVVMEYVDGVDLADVLKAGLEMPPRALAELGAVLAGALGRAHRARDPSTGEPLRVIHRDVKPANVMLTARGGLKLLDFGVARAQFDSRESHTGQFVLGTPNYLAPEYALTGESSPAVDIYGLALVIYEVAAGEVYGQPRLAEEPHRARMNERFAALPEACAPFQPLLRQMLQWEPARRPDGDAVEAALLALADTLPGPGLRAWCTSGVPRVQAVRPPPTDDKSGLLGRTCTIETPGSTSGDVVAAPLAAAGGGAPVIPRPLSAFGSAPTVQFDGREPVAAAPRPALPPSRPVALPPPAAVAPPPPASPPAASPRSSPAAPPRAVPPPPAPSAPPRPRPAPRSLGRDVLLGLLIGGGLGLVVVLVGVAWLLASGFP